MKWKINQTKGRTDTLLGVKTTFEEDIFIQGAYFIQIYKIYKRYKTNVYTIARIIYNSTHLQYHTNTHSYGSQAYQGKESCHEEFGFDILILN